MREKIKQISFGILISLIAFPTIVLGGTFVSSLIQGKTIEETVQILAEQIDVLIGRVEILEVKQAEQEETISKVQLNLLIQEACREADRLLFLLPPHSGEGIGRIVGPNNIVDLYNETKEALSRGAGDPRDLPIIEEYYQKYLQAQQKCDELRGQYNSLSQ